MADAMKSRSFESTKLIIAREAVRNGSILAEDLKYNWVSSIMKAAEWSLLNSLMIMSAIESASTMYTMPLNSTAAFASWKITPAGGDDSKLESLGVKEFENYKQQVLL